MSTVEFLLPQGNLLVTTMQSGVKTVIITAGGRKPQLPWFKNIALGQEIYCADKGIEICHEINIQAKLLCGDGDSTTADLWQQAKQAGTEISRHNWDKDDTDLQLLLKLLPEKSNIIATGVWGGRFDHLYSNVFSLLNYKKAQQVQVVLADEQEIMILLTAGEKLLFKPKIACEALSLLPLDENNEVSLKGVHWELEHSPLLLQRPYAISNLTAAENIEFICHKGVVAFYGNFIK